MEKELEKIEKENEKYLGDFENWLKSKELSQKVIKKHISNVSFYLSEYLNYCEPTKMKDGCYMLYDYLGDFFIRKCMWSTSNSIKETASSIKKFYNCMLDLKNIEESDYEYLKNDIKENLKKWQNRCDKFNDLNEDFDIMDFI